MKFSVIIPAWKAKYTIEKCLESVFNQTHFVHNEFEVIVAVDGCPETLEKIKSIKNRYQPQLNILDIKHNSGTYIALNTAISQAKYKNIVIFGADDEMYHDMIEKIASRYNEGFKIIRFKYDNYKNDQFLSQVRHFSYGAISFKKCVWEKLNGFVDWRVAGDSEFCYRAEKIYEQDLYNESLFRRNVTPQSMTQCEKYGANSGYRKNCKKMIEEIKQNRTVSLNRILTAKFTRIKKDIPLLTVGMPIYDMGEVASHAFKGLERQEFNKPWELIIMQESEGYYKWKHHVKNLRMANCVKISERIYAKKTTIGHKAFHLSMCAQGKVIVIQDGDDRSHKKRLHNSYEAIVKNKYDFYNEKYGLFVNLLNNKKIVFEHDPKIHPTGLNKAYSAKLFRKLLPDFRLVEKHLDRNLFAILKPVKIFMNNDKNFDGYFTDGYNKISKRLEYYNNPKPPFYPYDGQEIVESIPINTSSVNEISAYLINKTGDVERYSHFQHENKAIGLKFKVHRPLEPCPKIYQIFENEKIKKNIPNQTKFFQQVSNRVAFSDILDKSKKTTLILEDDVCFEPDARFILDKAIQELPEDFGVCYLGCYARHLYGKSEIYSDNLIKLPRSKIHRIWGCHAVIYSKNVKDILSKPYEDGKDTRIMDQELTDKILNDFDCFVINPMIAFQADFGKSMSQPNIQFDYGAMKQRSVNVLLQSCNL